MTQQQSIETQILDYLRNSSGLQFEVDCLAELSRLDSQLATRYSTRTVQHGGSYTDPVTGLPRQFDIRMRLRSSVNRTSIALAIECKRLQGGLLGVCLDRKASEAQHALITKWAKMESIESSGLYPSTSLDHPEWEMVAKDLAVILPAEDSKDKTRRGKQAREQEADVWGRWSQAFASLHDLVSSEHSLISSRQPDYVASFAAPVLVVPAGALWSVNLADPKPRQVSRLPFLLDKTIRYGDATYRVSHLEIVTIDGLESLLLAIQDHAFPATILQRGLA